MRLLLQTLKESSWHQSIETIQGFLRALLSISDGFSTSRIEQVLIGEFGMISQLITERYYHSIYLLLVFYL